MSIEILNVAKIFICLFVICFEICIFDILNTMSDLPKNAQARL